LLKLQKTRVKRGSWISPTVDLDVREGEVVAIIGPSGSGKSSILLSIIGVLDYEGSITLSGSEVRNMDKRQLRSRIAYVPDDLNSYLITFRVIDEVAFNLENLGYESKNIVEKSLEVLELTQLLELWDRDVWTLSEGEKQRLVIASALSTSPKIVLLDNAFSNIDWEMKKKFLDIFKEFLEEGHTIVYTGYSIMKEFLKPDHVVYLGETDEQYKIKMVKRTGLKDVLLEVEDLWFRYTRERYILRGVWFKAFRGERLTIIGKNGSGKTTLLKIISGLYKPSSGRVRIESRTPKIGKCIYVPQNPSISLFGRTPREELRYVESRWAEKIIEDVGLGYLLDKPMHSLSLGEKRLISLLSALSLRATLVVLDEPTVGLDHRLANMIGELFYNISNENVTLIMTTHDRDFAEAFSDRILLLEEGVVHEISER